MSKVIVAPLNWGLGHASRCVPIINALFKNNYIPVLASDGAALKYLRQELPELEFIELPSYNVRYGRHLKWQMLLQSYKFLKVKNKEHQILQHYLKKHADVVGIISDNRFGCYSAHVPSVYITHQIKVFSGMFTRLSSLIHQLVIKKFDECWVPDVKGSLLSGKLSSKDLDQKKYIGVLSRFQKQTSTPSLDVLIVLSGPEPNRTQLERKLKAYYTNTNLNVTLVRGIVEDEVKTTTDNNLTIVNFMLQTELLEAYKNAKVVICRAGYSSIMDLSVLQKKVILIPTKNQPEQEYLADHLAREYGISIIQENELERLDNIAPVTLPKTKVKLPENLFGLFQSK